MATPVQSNCGTSAKPVADPPGNCSTNCCHCEAPLAAPKSKAPRTTPPLLVSVLDVLMPAAVQSRPPSSAVLKPANSEPTSTIQLPASSGLMLFRPMPSAVKALMGVGRRVLSALPQHGLAGKKRAVGRGGP